MLILSPLFFLHLWWRGRRDPGYRQRWAERCGRAPQSLPHGAIVIHAASVGEINAATPLIDALRQQYPDRPVLLSCFTPTGSRRITERFGAAQAQVFLPLDLPWMVGRFFQRLQPHSLLILETEIWPNLYAAARTRGVPAALVNGRISSTSFRGYRRVRGLVGPALRGLDILLAQSEADAGRFRELGADPERLQVTGNLKYDLKLPNGLAQHGAELRARWGHDRPVILAASTHAGDETPILAAFRQIREHFPEALLALVPRHPERFTAAAANLSAAGLGFHRHSDPSPPPEAPAAWLVDAMGVLMAYYAACDLVIMGGSFEAIGGHNPLEPAALGKPQLFGPHMFNFADITGNLLAADAARQVENADQLARQAIDLLANPDVATAMGMRGQQQLAEGRGALEHTLKMLEPLLVERD